MKRIVVLNLVSILLCLSAYAGADLNVSLVIGKQIEIEPAGDYRNGPPPWAPAHGLRAKSAKIYHYYPRHEVYQNPNTGIWIFFENAHWTASIHLPSSVKISSISNFVSLEMDTEHPQAFHRNIKEAYPSSLVGLSYSSVNVSRPGRGHPGKGVGNHGKPNKPGKSHKAK